LALSSHNSSSAYEHNTIRLRPSFSLSTCLLSNVTYLTNGNTQRHGGSLYVLYVGDAYRELQYKYCIRLEMLLLLDWKIPSEQRGLHVDDDAFWRRAWLEKHTTYEHRRLFSAVGLTLLKFSHGDDVHSFVDANPGCCSTNEKNE
jgi:hypothetical protein